MVILYFLFVVYIHVMYALVDKKVFTLAVQEVTTVSMCLAKFNSALVMSYITTSVIT